MADDDPCCQPLDTATFEEAIAGNLAVVMVCSSGCTICDLQRQILTWTRDSLPQGTRLVGIDIDQQPELGHRYAIRTTPSLLLLEDGRELARMEEIAGVQSFRHWIDDALAQPRPESPAAADDTER